MRRTVLSVAAYAVATLAVQAISHFVVARDHYAAVPYLRGAPIFPLGILAMLLQGTLLALAFDRLRRPAAGIGGTLAFAWGAGLFLVSYIALAEPAKYTVPSVGAWAGVELAAGFVQFGVYGLLLWLVHRAAPVGRRPTALAEVR